MVVSSWICFSFSFHNLCDDDDKAEGGTVAGLNNCDDCLVFGRSGRAGRL